MCFSRLSHLITTAQVISQYQHSCNPHKFYHRGNRSRLWVILKGATDIRYPSADCRRRGNIGLHGGLGLGVKVLMAAEGVDTRLLGELLRNLIRETM